MSNIKTGLMYSPLSERIYWGQMNVKTGVRVGKEPKDVTSDFIGIMLQKFPKGTMQNIETNGAVEAVIFTVDEPTAKRFKASKLAFEALRQARDYIEDTGGSDEIIDLIDSAILQSKVAE